MFIEWWKWDVLYFSAFFGTPGKYFDWTLKLQGEKIFPTIQNPLVGQLWQPIWHRHLLATCSVYVPRHLRYWAVAKTISQRAHSHTFSPPHMQFNSYTPCSLRWPTLPSAQPHAEGVTLHPKRHSENKKIRERSHTQTHAHMAHTSQPAARKIHLQIKVNQNQDCYYVLYIIIDITKQCMSKTDGKWILNCNNWIHVL